LISCIIGTAANEEKCEEFEDELAGIREDFIDMLGDGWVVKLTDSTLLPRYQEVSTSVANPKLRYPSICSGSKSVFSNNFGSGCDFQNVSG
jgi:hypothetical protein